MLQFRPRSSEIIRFFVSIKTKPNKHLGNKDTYKYLTYISVSVYTMIMQFINSHNFILIQNKLETSHQYVLILQAFLLLTC